MKYVSFVLLLLACTLPSITGQFYRQNRDPDNPCFNKPTGYYVNNPARCRAFWLCQDGIATSINCPINQNFNEEAQICDLPQNFPCIDGEVPTKPTTESPTTITTESPTTTTFLPETTTEEEFDETQVCRNRPDGYFVNNPISCGAYWICSNNQHFDSHCREGLNFNEELQVCDDPEKFYCEDSETTEPETTDEPTTTSEPELTTEEMTTTEPTEPPFECPNNEMAAYPMPDTCTTYRLCFGGKFIIRSCADGLHFDEEHGQCDAAERVKCDRGLCPAVNDVNNIVTHPSDTSCYEFYVCYDGKPQLFRCSNGFMWNQNYQRCDHSYNVACQVSDPDEPLVVKCPGEDVPKPHIIPHPNSCNEYFICSMDVPYLQVCSDDLLYDPVLQTCNFPELIDCKK